MPARQAEPVARSTGLAVAAAGSTLVLAFFLFVDLGGTVTGLLSPFSLLAAAIWAGPFWLYAFLVRTRTGALITAAGLLAATTGFLVALFRTTHSTAGIGIFTKSDEGAGSATLRISFTAAGTCKPNGA